MSGTAATAPVRLTLYGRSYCHLCDEMRLALDRMAAEVGVALSLDLIDVDASEALEARYGERVPVLVHGQTEICHYFLDRAALLALLARLHPHAVR